MSTERNELQKVVYKSRWVDGIKDLGMATDAAIADAILAAGYRRPRTITTVEELNALAEGAVILSNGGEDSAQKDGEGYWYLWGGDIGLTAKEIRGPAIVLHNPDRPHGNQKRDAGNEPRC